MQNPAYAARRFSDMAAETSSSKRTSNAKGISKSAVIGAGACGTAVAHRLASAELFDEVVLADPVAGKAQGRALDIDHAGCIEGFRTRTVGVTVSDRGEGYEAITGSRIVVIVSGYSRRPGMRRLDLLEANAEAVAAVGMAVRAFAPDAVVIVLTNPLDEMTAFVHAASGLPAQRVLGQAGVLDSARFRYVVADELGVPVSSVQALTLGPHSEEMVPLVSACLVEGRPVSELLPADRIKALVERTKHAGTEVIGLLRTGSTSVAPSAATLTMVRAIVTDSGAELPVCARLDGEYGISDVYIGVVAALGSAGVVSVIERDLHPGEYRALHAAVELARPRQAAMRELAQGKGTRSA
jgi:malate dehydrogenase